VKLLIKSPNWIGDSVMATPAVMYLRRAFPEAEIAMISRRSTAGVWDGHPGIDRLIVGDDRTAARELREVVRSHRFEAAVLFPNSFRSAWLIWQCGIPRRFGYARGARSWLLTDIVVYRPQEWQTPTPQPVSKKSLRESKSLPREQPRHMVEYYLELASYVARQLGSDIVPPVVTRESALPPLVLPVQSQALEVVEKLITEEGVTSIPLIAIHPGAAYGNAKRWPLDRLAVAADRLADELDAAIVVTAGPSEAELCAELVRMLRARVLNWGPRLNIPQLVALLSRSTLFIGNDSGVTHLAAAVGCPTIAVFGPMDWNVTCPWSANAVVVRRSPPCAPCFLRECPLNHECMTAVTPDDVIAAARTLLSRQQGERNERA